MEILELLFGAVDLCGCFLEVGALAANVGAGTATVKTVKKRRARRQTAITQTPVPSESRPWLLVGLVVLALCLTLMVIAKYFIPRP